MKLFFYAPMKPLGHPHPSGDLTIASGLVRFLESRGHEIRVASRFRCRGVADRPWKWAQALSQGLRARRAVGENGPDLWLTYHTYYKAPDLLGPLACRGLCPYVIFQGAYSTKVGRRISTVPGFYANRHALSRAEHVFENRKEDLANILRLLPEDRVSYVPPGIYPKDFTFSESAREAFRKSWGAGQKAVVLSAAMFRPGVKAEGLRITIRACAELARQGMDLLLVIAGEGDAGADLAALARSGLPGRHVFLGRVPRRDMFQIYSAADVFAFPGIRESLGMVFLEAQSCGLPVVAFRNGGIPEVVDRGKTGLLTPLGDLSAFYRAIGSLCADAGLRRVMGAAGADRVRQVHDLAQNYRQVEAKLSNMAEGFRKRGGRSFR
ncbi:MAG: glycosyltransferase family 4 protein [Thermodesulfobacteriota bacterium]